MKIMLETIIAGIIGGVISPFIVSFLQHKCIWRSQKKIEFKYSVFQDAVLALSQFAVDATDPAVQSDKKTYKNFARVVEARPETFSLMERSRGMVKAFFSEEAFQAFDEALKVPISIENVPNLDFERARVEAIARLAKELGIKWQS